MIPVVPLEPSLHLAAENPRGMIKDIMVRPIQRAPPELAEINLDSIRGLLCLWVLSNLCSRRLTCQRRETTRGSN